MDFPILSALIALPLLAAVAVALVPKRRPEVVLPLGIGLSIIPLGLALWLFWVFEPVAGQQFTEFFWLVESWGVAWNVGVDGISMPMVVITTILVPVSLAVSGAITDRTRLFVAMVLALEAASIGIFVALDLVVFFVFFEAVLVPMTFIIGIWGSEQRIYAATKFFVYTAFGSALMLAGIIAVALLGADGGPVSFAWQDLVGLGLSIEKQWWLFAAFGIAFAIKVPIFPLHTWLPDAHVQAPTAGSVLLAGVLLKFGTYGFLRFCLPMFPDASVAAMPWIAGLGVIGIIYGAVVAIVQPDLKKLVAYSSVSHLGFIVLGTFSLTDSGLQGAVIQNVNHAITTGALFILVGMLYERRHTKLIAEFGGIAKSAPLIAGFFLFMSFASIGLPGLNGFIGEFLVLIGSFPSLPVHAAISSIGVILAAIYLLWAYQRVFTGEPTIPENQTFPEARFNEIAALVPLAILAVLLGLFPNLVLDKVAPSTNAVLTQIEADTGFSAPTPPIVIGADGA